MTAESGLHFIRSSQAAEKNHRFVPLALTAVAEHCKIGGICRPMPVVSCVALWNARDLVLGLEVVLADGRVWKRFAQSAQGHYRLRFKAPFHRRGRHAGHYYGSGTETVSAFRNTAFTACIAIADPDAAVRFCWRISALIVAIH